MLITEFLNFSCFLSFQHHGNNSGILLIETKHKQKCSKLNAGRRYSHISYLEHKVKRYMKSEVDCLINPQEPSPCHCEETEADMVWSSLKSLCKIQTKVAMDELVWHHVWTDLTIPELLVLITVSSAFRYLPTTQ